MRTAFLKPFDPKLRNVSEKIPENKINSKEAMEIAKLVLGIIKNQRQKKEKGVGLAAPQIGIFKRIILVDTHADGKKKLGKLKVFINPEIIWKSKKEEEWYEGCFSTANICGIVSRPISIKIKALKLKSLFVNTYPNRVWVWEPVEEKYTDYVARIFQHEVDHLNGKVFISHITDPEKLHKVSKKEFPMYRKSWKNWPKKYSISKYNKLYSNDK